MIKGTGDSVWHELQRKVERLNMTELFLLASICHPEKRIRSFELLNEAAHAAREKKEVGQVLSFGYGNTDRQLSAFAGYNWN